MSVQNRAAGRGSKTGTKTEPNVTNKQTVKTEPIKVVEKEKKQVVISFFKYRDLFDRIITQTLF